MSKVAFKIVICGAGIAGLCTAVALARSGHRVVILESAKELSPIGAGIHIPPNATSILRQWGLLEDLKTFAVEGQGFIFRRYDDSRILATTVGQVSGTEESAGEQQDRLYWLMKRAGYQRVLYEAAVKLGCEIRLAQKVVGVDEEGPAAILANGKRVGADLVVIADGMKSSLRQQIIPEEDTSALLQPISTYRAWAPANEILNDPETATLFDSPASHIWLGPNRYVIIYPTEGGSVLSISGTFPARNNVDTTWSQIAGPEDIERQFCGFDPLLRRILGRARDCKAWALAEVPRLPRWTSRSSSVVLVGDAAHGMLQFLAQGAAMATEDAAALAECMSRATSTQQIPALMRVYERARKWRCERVQAHARRNGYVIQTPDGEEQEVRDRRMAGKPLPDDEEVDCGPFFDSQFKSWLYGHDAVQHAKKHLSENGYA